MCSFSLNKDFSNLRHLRPSPSPGIARVEQQKKEGEGGFEISVWGVPLPYTLFWIRAEMGKFVCFFQLSISYLIQLFQVQLRPAKSADVVPISLVIYKKRNFAGIFLNLCRSILCSKIQGRG